MDIKKLDSITVLDSNNIKFKRINFTKWSKIGINYEEISEEEVQKVLDKMDKITSCSHGEITIKLKPAITKEEIKILEVQSLVVKLKDSLESLEDKSFIKDYEEELTSLEIDLGMALEYGDSIN